MPRASAYRTGILLSLIALVTYGCPSKSDEDAVDAGSEECQNWCEYHALKIQRGDHPGGDGPDSGEMLESELFRICDSIPDEEISCETCIRSEWSKLIYDEYHFAPACVPFIGLPDESMEPWEYMDCADPDCWDRAWEGDDGFVGTWGERKRQQCIEEAAQFGFECF